MKKSQNRKIVKAKAKKQLSLKSRYKARKAEGSRAKNIR